MPRAPDDVSDELLLLLGAQDPAEERRHMKRAGLSMVVRGDADYPALLDQIPAPPAGLWMRGSLEALGSVPVAVVGARSATAYGLAQAGRFAGRLTEEGVTVVSGGARGVDAEAHRAALRAGGPTVAVIGCGLGTTPYPPEHAGLYEAIVEQGGLMLSEFPSLWPVLTHNFPRRNRVIAGVSIAVVVIEATMSSGALITARHAHDDQDRKVFAVPGPVDSRRSEGCNRAIHDHLAEMAMDPSDVTEYLRSNGVLLAAGAKIAARRRDRAGALHPGIGAALPPSVRAALPIVRKVLRKEAGADCARVVEVTGLPAHEVQAAITLLELN
jgi:DNA processing protein